MLIKLNNLKEGTHYYTIHELIESVGLEAPFVQNVYANICLHKLHNQIVLENKLKFNAQFECDRCNSDFDVQLNTEYRMVYLFGKLPEKNEDELNFVYLPFDASEIKLDDDIRDYAILAIPMKKLCKEDCKGLCPSCGKNLNEGECSCDKQAVDPRWLPLQNLKNQIDNK